MRAYAERVLQPRLSEPPDAELTTAYGDRIEVRRIWTASASAESIGLYAATQVFVVQREVIALSPAVAASIEMCYAVSSAPVRPDPRRNATELLRRFRGHWAIEAKNHYRRDVVYLEDRSPVKNHNAARIYAGMKMLAIFLCEIGAHQPRNARERSLPEFHRACAINGIDRAINWMTRTHNPLRR